MILGLNASGIQNVIQTVRKCTCKSDNPPTRDGIKALKPKLCLDDSDPLRNCWKPSVSEKVSNHIGPLLTSYLVHLLFKRSTLAPAIGWGCNMATEAPEHEADIPRNPDALQISG